MVVSAAWCRLLWPKCVAELRLHGAGWYRDEETNEWRHFNGEFRNLFDESEES